MTRRVVVAGNFRPHVRQLLVEESFAKPLDTAQELPHAQDVAGTSKGRAARITDLALEGVRAGTDPDTAWKNACAKVSCAPGSVSLAYNIFLILATKPSK